MQAGEIGAHTAFRNLQRGISVGSENEEKKEKGDQKEGKRPERWGDRDPDTGRAKDHERKGHRHRKR